MDDSIDHFTVVCLVSQPLSEREAEVDLVHFDANLFPLLMENRLCLKLPVGIRRTCMIYIIKQEVMINSCPFSHVTL